MEIRFLSLSRVMELHRDSIEKYGGDVGIRDIGLLESALAQPRAAFSGEYMHDGLGAMAAAYLFHIAKNHPFVDGNKRTAALAAFQFLFMNGIDFKAPENEFQQVTFDVAAGKLDKATATAFFQQHVKSS